MGWVHDLKSFGYGAQRWAPSLGLIAGPRRAWRPLGSLADRIYGVLRGLPRTHDVEPPMVQQSVCPWSNNAVPLPDRAAHPTNCRSFPNSTLESQVPSYRPGILL